MGVVKIRSDQQCVFFECMPDKTSCKRLYEMDKKYTKRCNRQVMRTNVEYMDHIYHRVAIFLIACVAKPS